MNLIEYVEHNCRYGWQICIPEGIYCSLISVSDRVYYLHFARRIYRSSRKSSSEYSTRSTYVNSVVDFTGWKHLNHWDMNQVIIPDLVKRLVLPPTGLEYWDLI